MAGEALHVVCERQTALEPMAIPQGVEPHAARDAEQPGAEPGPRLERSSMTVNSQEHILTQVFGRVMVAKKGEQLAVNRRAVPPVQLLERGRIVPADTEHQFGVTVALRWNVGPV
jgi:hypothetical protein